MQACPRPWDGGPSRFSQQCWSSPVVLHSAATPVPLQFWGGLATRPCDKEAASPGPSLHRGVRVRLQSLPTAPGAPGPTEAYTHTYTHPPTHMQLHTLPPPPPPEPPQPPPYHWGYEGQTEAPNPRVGGGGGNMGPRVWCQWRKNNNKNPVWTPTHTGTVSSPSALRQGPGGQYGRPCNWSLAGKLTWDPPIVLGPVPTQPNPQ